MASFNESLSFSSYEAAVNGIARIARTQGFQILQRRGPQKTLYEQEGLASFGCTASGCPWFITINRVPIGGPSTSTAPAEQWLVYTLRDTHKSNCKPSRSCRRRPSLSSISSLESLNSENELPLELLRPYERSPSLPVLMSARGGNDSTTSISNELGMKNAPLMSITESLDSNVQPDPTRSDPPDPIALSNYIQELFASIANGPTQPEHVPHTRAPLATLSEPLAIPLGFNFPSGNHEMSSQPLQSGSINPHLTFSQPFGQSEPALGSSSGSFVQDLNSLPDAMRRSASIATTLQLQPQTIDPSALLSPRKDNGYGEDSVFTSAFFNDHLQHQSISHGPPKSTATSTHQEYTAPIANDRWSEDDDSDGDQDLSQGFFTQDFDHSHRPEERSDDQQWKDPNGGSMEQQSSSNDEQESYHHHQVAPASPATQPLPVEDTSSSSDSDIPAEVLIKTNTSRSIHSNSPRNVAPEVSPPSEQDQPFYEPLDNYEPEAGPSHWQLSPPKAATAAPARFLPPKSFAYARMLPEEEEFFDIYQIFDSFEDAEEGLLKDARKSGAPLKIRYRPNALDRGAGSRKQACFECLRLCTYRIYLKDDHQGHWRVINIEGAHKKSCFQDKDTGQIRRGTNPFRANKSKENDSMEVTVPVWEPGPSKRKKRAESFSSDRSSSPSILVVTHSDAVMKSVKTKRPGFTPPRESWLTRSHSPTPPKQANFRGRKSGRSPEKAIEIEDSEDQDLANVEDQYHDGPDLVPNGYDHGHEDYHPSPMRDSHPHPRLQAASSVNHDRLQQQGFARKKLPTTEQLLHDSAQNGVRPRHKIPTKPLGRSPNVTRARLERRQAASSVSFPYAPTLSAKYRKRLLGQSASHAGGSSEDEYDPILANDDSQSNASAREQSSRSLRGARRSTTDVVTRPTRSQSGVMNGRGKGRKSDGTFLPASSSNPTPRNRSNRAAARPLRQLPTSKPKLGIKRNLNKKMSLAEAGFTVAEQRFLAKGGYTTVAGVAREGLSMSYDDFSMFQAWLGDLELDTDIAWDPWQAKQAVKHRVKTVSEEVRVRANIIWEAAGMMEEGSDTYDYGSPEPDLGMLTGTDVEGNRDAVSNSKGKRKAAGPARFNPSKRAKFPDGGYDLNELSGSSGIEVVER